MNNEEIAKNYLEWVSRNYTYLSNKYRKFCDEKDYQFSQDILSDTYLKIYDKIIKNGIKDSSDHGYDAYTFISFKTNLKRESMYKRESSRDRNVTDDEINDLYDEYYNEHNDTSINKVRKDLWLDYFAVYVHRKLSEHFGQEKAYIFLSKYLVKNNTYKKLAAKHNNKGIRNEILEMRRWLQENLDKEEVLREFQEKYDELL